METHANVFALDDLLVASSNDIIKNGFNDSNLPPVIKAWVAEKVLSLLPVRFLSEFLKSLLENRNLPNFDLISTHLRESSNQQTDENTLFTENNIHCDFFDDTFLPEISSTQAIPPTKTQHFHLKTTTSNATSSQQKPHTKPSVSRQSNILNPALNLPVSPTLNPFPPKKEKPEFFPRYMLSSDEELEITNSGKYKCPFCDDYATEKQITLYVHVKQKHPRIHKEKQARKNTGWLQIVANGSNG